MVGVYGEDVELKHWTADVRLTCIFTALHAMQTRSSDENSVRLSVCLSVRLSVCPSVCPSHACIVTKR